ncbi:MAG: hypothetical protein LUO83_03965 [Methanothrix sp.]|nr:hypothetical protein [Methanothrix sp.]
MQSLHSALFAGTVSLQGAPSAAFAMTTPEGGGIAAIMIKAQSWVCSQIPGR